jgi:hypothetical protein
MPIRPSIGMSSDRMSTEFPGFQSEVELHLVLPSEHGRMFLRTTHSFLHPYPLTAFFHFLFLPSNRPPDVHLSRRVIRWIRFGVHDRGECSRSRW